MSLWKPYIVGTLENSTPDRYYEDCRYLEEQYERFIRKWHNFKEFAEKKARYAENEENAKIIMLSILSTFYSKPYEAKNEEEFYPEFDERLKEIVGIIRRV